MTIDITVYGHNYNVDAKLDGAQSELQYNVVLVRHAEFCCSFAVARIIRTICIIVHLSMCSPLEA